MAALSSLRRPATVVNNLARDLKYLQILLGHFGLAKILPFSLFGWNKNLHKRSTGACLLLATRPCLPLASLWKEKSTQSYTQSAGQTRKL